MAGAAGKPCAQKIESRLTPFPSQQTQPSGRPSMPPPRHPQAQPGLGYPPAVPEVPRTEPPRRNDPASYDLGSYGLPPQQPTQPPMPPRDQGQQAPQHSPQQWQQPGPPPSFGFPGNLPPQQSSFQQGGYPPPFGQPQQSTQPPQLGAGGQPEPEYRDDLDDEEPRPRRRRWLVVGALVGSIAVGSGMAYAYKLLVSPKPERSQVVRAPKDAIKATPNDRGGKQFPNADSRVNNNNRLPSEGTSTAAGGGDGSPGFTNSSGVRVVQTIPVGPGSSAVPGMTIVGPGTGPGSTLPPAAMQPPSANALPPAIPSQQVKTAAAPSPPPQAPARPAARPAPQPEAEAPQRVARAEPPKAAAPAAPSGEPAAARPKTVSGYVAVLGFQRSQLDAMKMMADLQQKYDVLRDKKLEIVQSDQSSRGLGTIYRVVVGPRSGITPVREVCNRLFQAGMPKQGCYPLAE